MREFDFNSECFKKRRQSVRDFYEQNYHKHLSEEAFIRSMKRFYAFEHGKHARQMRSTSTLRREYRHLNKEFDFFRTLENDLVESAKNLYGEPTIH